MIILCQLLKWGIVCITGSATILMGFLTAFPFLHTDSLATPAGNVVVAAICFVIMLLAGWVTFRIAREPVARVRKGAPRPLAIRGLEALRARSQWATDPLEAGQIAAHARAGNFNGVFAALDAALSRFPNDVLLLAQKGDYHLQQQDFVRAEEAYAAAIKSLADLETAAYPLLLMARLSCTLKQGQMDRVESACLTYLDGTAQVADKIQVVDHIVCTPLYEEPPRYLPQIERLTRKALELAPGTLTLQGTLGGILVEQGHFAEAEQLLRACRTRSVELYDQAFASLYLGKVAMHQGDIRAAKELLKQAMILHTQPSLVQKANRSLLECERREAPLTRI